MSVMRITGSTCLLMLMVAPVLGVDDEDELRDEVVTEEVVTEEAVELSVPPLAEIDYPSDRPHWISEVTVDGFAKYDFVDDLNVVIVTAPSDSPEQCRERLEIEREELIGPVRRSAYCSPIIAFLTGLCTSLLSDFAPWIS